MMDAGLFDDVEVACKQAAERTDSPLRMKLFGGKAVVLVGDFVQLPPAAGTTMDSPLQLMAFELKYKQNIRSGLKLLWDNPNVRLYELTEQIRIVDAWWSAVCTSMRSGTLSSTYIEFMHGKNTLVPGSFLETQPSCGVRTATGTVLCGNDACLSLVGEIPDPYGVKSVPNASVTAETGMSSMRPLAQNAGAIQCLRTLGS